MDYDMADFEDLLPCVLCGEMLRDCYCPKEDIEDALEMIQSQKEIEDMNRESRFVGYSI